MKRIGAIMFWVGLLITIIGVVVAVTFGVSTFRGLADRVGDSAPMSGGSTTVTMKDGELRTIYGATTQDTETAECSVTGPDGESVPVSPSNEFVDVGDAPVTEVGSFESTVAGEYEVECTGGTTLISPAFDLAALGSGLLGLLGGILGAGLGLLLVLIGAILWFVGRSKAKKTAQSASYGPGGGFHQSNYAQGGYDQNGPQQGGPGSAPPSTNPYQSGQGSTPPPPPPSSNG